MMKGLSEKEMQVVANLEFEEKYFFSKMDIAPFFATPNQLRHTVYKLVKKGRIISLSKSKYYLIPVKAKTGKWVEDSFILADEVMDGRDYFIGGWAAAHYWRLTDQVPMRIEVYSAKRQGEKKFLTTSIIFRRTTRERLKDGVEKKIDNHSFRILSKVESKKWMKSRK